MSRIGKIPVSIPSGVDVRVESGSVITKGSKGELSFAIPEEISVDVADGAVSVSAVSTGKQVRAFHGLTRSLIANMVEGVSNGFSKVLLIEGVGFRAAIQGANVTLSLGFASPILYVAPDTVSVTEEGGTRITISGIDKQQVGLVASRIRSYFPVEPYKGKGIRYSDEVVKRKVGKTVA
ncbi:MAG: 50S ribosomal protein L6 [Kiritimatiellae bacterium]|nr:50S ribosomal protein L6 [Kiritimatiellia bacterium]